MTDLGARLSRAAFARQAILNLRALRGRLVKVTVEDVATLLDALPDPGRTPPPGVFVGPDGAWHHAELRGDEALIDGVAYRRG